MASKTADFEPKKCTEVGHSGGVGAASYHRSDIHETFCCDGRESVSETSSVCCLTTLGDTWVAGLDKSWRHRLSRPSSALMSLTLSDTL